MEERQAGVKSYHAEQMDFRVLRGREEETRDVSVPRLSLLLKITGRETESQFWNRKLGSFFWRRDDLEKETKNKETKSEN